MPSTSQAPSAREDLLNRVLPLVRDPKHCETLRLMSDPQLKIVAETLEDLARWTPERRSAARKAVMRRVQVNPAEGNAFRTQYGLQEDISDRGIGLFLNRPVPPGTRVRIRSGGEDSVGTVYRCRQEKGGWTIGIMLERSAAPNTGD